MDHAVESSGIFCSQVSPFGWQGSFSWKEGASLSCEESPAVHGGHRQAFVFMTVDRPAGHPFSACLITLLTHMTSQGWVEGGPGSWSLTRPLVPAA